MYTSFARTLSGFTKVIFLTSKNKMIARGCLAVLTKTKLVTRTLATLPPEVVIFPDDEMVVCWHPEQAFPYECSKPLPESKPLPYSVLKIKDKEVKQIFARKPHERELAAELAKLTHTTKHRWFPRSRDKKAKDTKPDRTYL